MTKGLRRQIRKCLKLQITETRKFLFRREESDSCEIFKMISPAYYEKFIKSLNSDEFKEFINTLNPVEKHMLFDVLSNYRLRVLLLMGDIEFEDISDDRLKEMLAEQDSCFFQTCWEYLCMNDKVRFITLILSTPRLQNFCLEIFSKSEIANIENVIAFMDELSCWEDAQDEIYSLMATLPSEIIARFLENDCNVITEKLVNKLIETDRLVYVFEKIEQDYKVHFLSNCNFMAMEYLKDKYDICRVLKDDELLELFYKVKDNNIQTLFNLEQIIRCYCICNDETDKKFILQNVLMKYGEHAYVELFAALPKLNQLEMLELMIEMFDNSDVEMPIKSILRDILKDSDVE